MTKGITYAGEIAEVGQGTTPSQVVEIVCTNPRFLERAAEKKPNFIVRLISGAYSYPRDWWCGIFYCAMQLGLFGAEGKAMSDPWRRDLNTVLSFIIKNPVLAMRLLGARTQHQMTSPEFYGRIGGGVFTSYASGGGRFGNRILSGPVKVARMPANFILASTGAAVLAVKYGGRDIVAVFDAVLTGNYGSGPTGEQYKEMFRAAIESSEPVSQEDADALVEITEGILHCLNNPGEYMPGGGASQTPAPRPQTWVPVGTVSSARPNGVMGLIPAGSETNALDVISENNAWMYPRP
jgi:hypothetical protein